MTEIRRVVSLAPSATATLAAMGAADLVVGATAHCDLDRPAVGGWLNPDFDRLDELDPDLVCTCDDLQSDVRDDLRDRGFDVHHAAPTTLDTVVDAFVDLGEAVGRPDAGSTLADDVRARLARVDEHVASVVADAVDSSTDPERDTETARPVVYCEEWSDPPMAAGNWVPEAVERAGGRYPFVDPGERSHEVTEADVVAHDPDHVVLHPCGRGDRADPGVVADRGWNLDAEVHVFDDSLLNQPSPRLVDGVETLAQRLHGPIPTGR